MCGTVSNAFEKSRIRVSVCLPLSSDFAISSMVLINWVSHDLPFLKPCWFVDSDGMVDDVLH